MEDNNNLEKVYHSFDEWQKGTLNWSLWWFGYGEQGVLHKPEMVTKIHVLPESEYQKIVDKQEEILADHVKKNLAVYIQKFEERLKAPGEREKRIEDEIQEVDKILTDKALTFVPIWYDEGKAFATGSVAMSPTGGQHVSQDFKNEIAYWYYQIIIKADPMRGEPRTFILREDEGNYARYIPQVAALVLYQYRQYLLNLTGFDIDKFTFRDSNPPEGKTHYGLCCRDTDEIFEGLRKYKPSREEFFMFKDSFHEHPFAYVERLRSELPKVIDEIFDRAAHLRRDLQAYFLEEMGKDVVHRIKDNPSLINERLTFQMTFKERLDAVQEAEQKRLDEIEKSQMPAPLSPIHLNQARGVKTDFLRVLDALWELKFFTDESGQVVTQKAVMKAFAEFLGDDFSTFSNDLSQSYIHTSLEKNVSIFDEMKQKIQEKVIKKT